MENKDQETQVEDQKVDQAEPATEASPFDETSPVTETPEVAQAPAVAEPVVEPDSEPTPEVAQASEASVDGVYVTVTVPKPFKLRTSHDRIVDYVAGTYEMLVEDAEHWFSKAQGVTIYKK